MEEKLCSLSNRHSGHFIYWDAVGHNALTLDTTTATVVDRWYHTCITYDGGGASTGIGTIYLDGINEGTGTASANQFVDRAQNTQIGYGYKIGGDLFEDMDGLIDEVAIWNRALTAEEIQQHYQNGLQGLGYLAIEAAVDIDPDTLNLRSKRKWITCYIELPEGYDVSDINVDSVFLEGLLEVQHSDVQDGILMVKFDMQDVIAYIELYLEITPPEDVTLMVMGELTDGSLFEGSDTIRVIAGGK